MYSLETSIFAENLQSRDARFLFQFRNPNRFLNSDAYKLSHKVLKWDLKVYKLCIKVNLWKKVQLWREINFRTNNAESRSKIKPWHDSRKLLTVDVMQGSMMSESCAATEGVACALTAESLPQSCAVSWRIYSFFLLSLIKLRFHRHFLDLAKVPIHLYSLRRVTRIIIHDLSEG